MELEAKGVFSKEIIDDALRIRMSMTVSKTQKNSSKHNKLAFIATHQALILNTGSVDRNRLAAVFGLSPEESVKVFRVFSPLQLGIKIVSEPDTVYGCVELLCRQQEFGLYDEDTVQTVRNYAQMCMTARPNLKDYVPYTVAVAILFDFMQTNGIVLQDTNKFYNIVKLRGVTIDSVRRIIRG